MGRKKPSWWSISPLYSLSKRGGASLCYKCTPRYMISMKRPKLVFHLVVWGERERERERDLVSVRERVSVFSLCGSPPLTLLQRFTSLSSCNLHPVVSIEPLCCSPPIPLVHSFILHCLCIPIKSRLSLDFSALFDLHHPTPSLQFSLDDYHILIV